ncbi:MAG: ATP-dependent DNA ligase [Acidobacteria bacterium]|nr:MAG: ATP-dependent DNA ligase [Acidobacteriota bacterium]
MTMLRFAQTCEAIAATTKKLEKTAIVADYLRSLSPSEAAEAAIFLSGRPFAAYRETTLQVGGSLLWKTIAELSGKPEQGLTASYRRHGDSGSVAAEVLPEKPQSLLSLVSVQQSFEQIASARGPAAKGHLLRELLHQATPLEAKYIVKIISGDLRIGLKESLVEEAIAKAFDAQLDDVKRANMLLGDIGETLVLALAGRLAEAKIRLFNAIDFMLASPVESAQEALSYFENAAVEDKYDGIRAQAHISKGEAHLYSRTRDEITESFPELPPALAGLPDGTILDGEIVAWSPHGAGIPTREEPTVERNPGGPDAAPVTNSGSATPRALPFSTLQQRLGRKKVSEKMMREIPVAYLVFDILCADGDLLLDLPLRERAQILDKLLAAPRAQPAIQAHAQSQFAFQGEERSCAPVLRAPVSAAHSPDDIEALFTAARARGNEGLMIKDPESRYTPGRRGKSWLKLKRELATLDVVVTAVEYGHGKRIGVLSDYTFAVWNGDRLENIGKAYSGLTDAEIAEMTEWFLEHVVRDEGLRLQVEPKIVLEVAFNNMMESTRHESGYSLRFPRIVRLRPDKLPEDADTIETVRKIYERQHTG